MNLEEHIEYTEMCAKMIEDWILSVGKNTYAYSMKYLPQEFQIEGIVSFVYNTKWFAFRIDRSGGLKLNSGSNAVFIPLNKHFKDPFNPTEEECTLFEIEHPDYPILFRKEVSH